MSLLTVNVKFTIETIHYFNLYQAIAKENLQISVRFYPAIYEIMKSL